MFTRSPMVEFQDDWDTVSGSVSTGTILLRQELDNHAKGLPPGLTAMPPGRGGRFCGVSLLCLITCLITSLPTCLAICLTACLTTICLTTSMIPWNMSVHLNIAFRGIHKRYTNPSLVEGILFQGSHEVQRLR